MNLFSEIESQTEPIQEPQSQTVRESAAEYQLTMKKSEFKKENITSSRDADKYIRQFYGDDIEIYESFFLLLLNRQRQTTGYVKISQGGRAGTVVDPVIVAKYAIDSLADAVILAHNHPSGTLRPSEQDDILTKRIKDGLNLFRVPVLDHIILTAEGYYSYADEGKI